LAHLGAVELAADQALDAPDGVLAVGDHLALGGVAEDALLVLRLGDDGGDDPGALGIGHDQRLAPLQVADAGVGRPQVDADVLGHQGSGAGAAAGPAAGWTTGTATLVRAGRSSLS